MSLTIRRILVVLGSLLLVASYFGFGLLLNQKEPPPRKPNSKIIKQVDTFLVINQNIPTTLQIQGTLVAFDKIELFSEVSGTLVSSSKPFKEGSYFPKGAVLIKIDEQEARYSLQAQKSTLLNGISQIMPDLKIDYKSSFDQWNTYLEVFDIEHPIKAFPEPKNKQEKLFIASKNLYSQYYNIKSAEERLSKYEVRAPFNGVITETAINPGALVRNGQKLGTLMNTSNYELEATVPLRDLKYIKKGNRVELFSDDIEGNWNGTVKRINDQIDPNTQTVTVFVGVNGRNLREGMYLRGDIASSQIENAVKIPKDLIVKQSEVYALVDTTVRLINIDLIKLTENEAILRGLENGTPLIKKVFPGIYDGMPVQVNSKHSDSHQSTASAAPISSSPSGISSN